MARRFFIWAAIIGLFLDQVSKVAVFGLLDLGESVRLAGNFLRIIHADNPQGVFGMSFGPRIFYYIFPALGAVLVAWLGVKSRDRWSATAFGLILAGALGNLVDRVRLAGHVIDFIDVGLRGWRWYTFNVADTCVVVGVIMMLAHEFLFRHRPSEPAPTAEGGSAASLPR